MSDYQGISSTIFDEPEYRDGTEMLVAMYIQTHMDNAGVAPVREKTIASACRTSVPKIRKILDYFCEIGKAKLSKNRSHIWWKSGSFYKLFKGNCTSKQKQSVITCIQKWNTSQLLGNDFALLALQHLENKYNLRIPIPSHINTHINTHTHIDVEEETPPATTEKVIDPNQKTHNPYRNSPGDNYYKYDHDKNPFENMKLWSQTKEASDRFDAVALSYGGNGARAWIDKVFDEEFALEVEMKLDWAFESLFLHHNGSFERMFFSWLKRARSSGSLTKYRKEVGYGFGK